MDRFLSELIKYQSASVTIRPANDGFNEYLEGELRILIKGENYAFTVEGQTIEAVIGGLERKYLQYGWAGEVPVVEVHSGVAEVASGDAAIVDLDAEDSLSQSIMEIALFHNSCPSCGNELGDTGRADRKCPICHYTWTKEDE